MTWLFACPAWSSAWSVRTVWPSSASTPRNGSSRLWAQCLRGKRRVGQSRRLGGGQGGKRRRLFFFKGPHASPTLHLSQGPSAWAAVRASVGALPGWPWSSGGLGLGLGRGGLLGLCRHRSRVPCRGIVTGIYTTSSPEACQYISHDCRANIIVVDAQKQLEKILKVWGRNGESWGLRLGVLGDV